MELRLFPPTLVVLCGMFVAPFFSLSATMNSGNSLFAGSPATGFDGCEINCTDARRHRLEILRGDLLTKLKLTTLPNITGLPNIREISPLYNMFIDQDQLQMQSDHHQSTIDEDNFIRTKKFVIFASDVPTLIQHPHRSSAIYFDLSGKRDIYDIIDKVHLYVFVRGPTTGSSMVTVKVSVASRKKEILQGNEVVTRSNPEIQEIKPIHNTTVQLTEDEGTWVNISVWKEVKNWKSDPNYGLVVQAGILNETSRDLHGPNLAVVEVRPEDVSRRPFIVINAKDPKKRKRRSHLECAEGDGIKHCCRYPLRVDFSEEGWDFVIMPKSYQANYCAGECVNNLTPSSNHAHIRYTALKGRSQCCAPSKFEDLSMLYYDEKGTVVFGTVPEMIVTRCGCA